MGRPFDQNILVTDSDIEDNTEVTREDQLTQDLIHAWDVSVDRYVQQEAELSVVSADTVRAELNVNQAVHDLLGSLPRLLARVLVEREEERENTRREQRRQQVLQQYKERNQREEEQRDYTQRRNRRNSNN